MGIYRAGCKMRNVIWLFAAICMVGLAEVGFAQGAPDSRFKVFDGTLYEGKPNLAEYGMVPIDILYVSRFWPDAHLSQAMKRLPDEKRVRLVGRAAAAKGQPVVVDIEHWSLRGSDAQVKVNLAKYVTVLQWLRDEASRLSLGYFGRLPMTAYGWALDDTHSRNYRRWQRENGRRGALAPFVDAIYPPLYTYSSNREDWVRYARANLREAHRYGKPVYAFLWPQYAERNTVLGLQYLPAEFWRLQLETVRRYADGVVIWGGWDSHRNRPAAWDEAASWWSVTKAFLDKIRGRAGGER